MSNLQAQKELLEFINILSANVGIKKTKKNTFVSRIHYELSSSSLSQKRNADSQFQQKHRGTALVNKRWDEEDQYHCSPFNTAPEEEKQIFSPAALSSCTGTQKHDVDQLCLSRSIFPHSPEYYCVIKKGGDSNQRQQKALSSLTWWASWACLLQLDCQTDN